MSCDINCDMGEGIGNDSAIMPYITSANIACGYHAGNEETMRATVMLAKDAGVAIGAHPSFLDREHFGRTEMPNITPAEVYTLVTEQLKILQQVAAGCGAALYHVKPHGALYNLSARDARIASAIAQAVFHFDNTLILFGLSNSFSIREASLMGLATASEVFADRTYANDGSLTPRSQPNALIDDEKESLEQVVKMIKEGKVTSTSGNEIGIVADTICLHGDGKNAVAFAAAIHRKLEDEGIRMARVPRKK